MPDFSMCIATLSNCSMADKCNRNSLSGTIAEPKRQSYFENPPITEKGCGYYMPVLRRPDLYRKPL